MRIQRLLLVPLLVLGLPLGACRVQQTQEGELPRVEGGQVPQYDVDPARVEVGTDTQVVTVPDVDIRMPRDTPRRP